ncbi:MAG: methyltransferase domain-containing protein [Deltaproteobacteria bacterium]|nr:methyltransferase domain-containing protein [Deltaproteobacteria bacterium]
MPPTPAALRRALRRAAHALDGALGAADRLSGGRVPVRARDLARAARAPLKSARAALRGAREGEALHEGARATLRRAWLDGLPVAEKRYEDTPEALAALGAELRAHELLGARAWKLPLLAPHARGFSTPLLPRAAQLDYAAARLSPDERRAVAAEALSAALDLYAAGIAHRDLHGGNLFWHDGRLLVADFEASCPQPAPPPPFARSYDLVGEGLPSPHGTSGMCYAAHNARALERLLGVPLAEGLDALAALLRRELVAECASFMRTREDFGARAARHAADHGLAYCSIELPALLIPPSAAQRDSARRFARYGLGADSLAGKRVVDLGCNVGAMSFGAHLRGAARVLGVEYDAGKVEVARRVAAFAGAAGVRFEQGDVDALTAERLGGPADVVFCFAIEGHVRDPQRLYRLLGELTTELLCFEGNAGCDVDFVELRLRAAGFGHIERLGPSDDEQHPANNTRPMLKARRLPPA